MSTGEVKEIQHTDSRIESPVTLRQTFQRLSMLVNANTADTSACRFVTLTYRENMTDREQLYTDFDIFMKRLRRFCKKQGHERPEYIAVAEPQQRGAWHLHSILIFPGKAPYLAKKDIERLWEHGFVHIRAVDSCDNCGAYLSAYLADLEIPPEMENIADSLPTTEHIVDGQKKRFLKGQRLLFYPKNFRIYRCSRGVQRPTVERMTLRNAEKLVRGMTMTYEKAVEVSDDTSDFETVVYTRYYNKVRSKDKLTY